MCVTRIPLVALSVAWQATVVGAAAAAAQTLMSAVVPLPLAAHLLWLVCSKPQVDGAPLGVAPFPFSVAEMHQTCPEIVPATTALAENVLPTTPSAPSLAGEGTPCGSAQWEAAPPSPRPTIVR